MDNPLDHSTDDEHVGIEQDEASIRAALERSRQDIADGRIKPLGPVLNHMRAVAKKIRHEQANKN